MVAGLDLAPVAIDPPFLIPSPPPHPPFVPGNSSGLSESSHHSNSRFTVGRSPASSTVDPLHRKWSSRPNAYPGTLYHRPPSLFCLFASSDQ